MNLKWVSIPAVVLATTTLAATPAFAQRRGAQPHENRQSENRSQSERRGSVERAQPRAEAPRPAPAPAPRVTQAPRIEQAPRIDQRAEPRRDGGRMVVPRNEVRNGVAVPRVDGRHGAGVAVPRVAPYHDNHYYYYGGHYSTGPWRGWYGYAPFHPYYFRPHFSLGFGIYLGYPVPYYDYPYPVPVYGYGAPYGEVAVGPNNNGYGGVALEITPGDAAVYVDGTYAGVVTDFDGTRQPLTLTPGTHHIEIDQTGFEPLAFDVTIQPGMVTPYQGSLRPY